MAADPMSPTDMLTYGAELRAPKDLGSFWADTLARSPAGEPAVAARDTPLHTVTVSDLSFPGYGGQQVRGWVLTPRGADRPLPCVVEYIGYGGGRGFPHDWLFWSACGYVHVVMDTRGQGSTWRHGDTPDSGSAATPHAPGFLTDGLPDRASLYYRRLITDAVRAVDAARALPEVDPAAITVAGGSQGGGLALAVAALRGDLFAAMPDVPFLCDIRRGADVALKDPYLELVRWVSIHRDQADAAFAALDYVDAALLAPAATCPAMFSVAMRDEICPPSTVYAAYNRYGGTNKTIVQYPWNDHEGGQSFHQARQAAWLSGLLQRARKPTGAVNE
jgi:cephalosporin-C deacetylase